MDIASRLIEVMTALHLKQADLIRCTGYTGPAIKKITDGQSEPKFGFLKSILQEYPEISARWLITGEGEMIRSKDEIIEEDDMNRIFRALTRIIVEIGELREDVTDIKVGSARQSSE